MKFFFDNTEFNYFFSIEIHKEEFKYRKFVVLKSLWRLILFGVIEARTSKKIDIEIDLTINTVSK